MLRRATAWLLALGVLGASAAALEGEAAGGSDREAIETLIEQAYVGGIHRDRNEAAVRAGFHPGFTMYVRSEGGLTPVSLDVWLERLKLDGKPSSSTIAHAIEQLDVTGEAASVKLELSRDGKHVFTDYFLLYRFADGWKIVAKSFQSHR